MNCNAGLWVCITFSYLLSFLPGPEKRPHIPHKIVDEGSGRFRIEFTTVEVGSYVIDVQVSGLTVPDSPLIAKAYDAGLIKVTDITDGVVGDLSTFRGESISQLVSQYVSNLARFHQQIKQEVSQTEI